MIWDALFIQRSPLSEAARGVLTTLIALGLKDSVEARDLKAIRAYYDTFRGKGIGGAERFVEKVYNISGVSYAVMTNIPFSQTETQHWRPKKKVGDIMCIHLSYFFCSKMLILTASIFT